MTVCRVLAPLLVEQEGTTYMPGSTVDLDDAVAHRLAKAGIVAAPGAGQAGPADGPEAGHEARPDLSALHEGMTRGQLMQVARAHGVEVPARARKAEIIALLKEL